MRFSFDSESYNVTGNIRIIPVSDYASDKTEKSVVIDVYYLGEFINSLDLDEVPFDVSTSSDRIKILFSYDDTLLQMTYIYSSGRLELLVRAPSGSISGTFVKSSDSYSLSERSADSESQTGKDLKDLITTLKKEFKLSD
jgi:hypothetical protein